MLKTKNKLVGRIKTKNKLTGKLNNAIIHIEPKLENLEVTPTKEVQTFTHENSYGYDKVIVEPIPDEYIIPDGTLEITENATYDVTEYSRVNARVYPTPNLQDKSITITENGTQTITCDNGYDGLNDVEIIVDVPSFTPEGEEETIELPSGYTLLDRLISHGEEYIDIGIQPSTNLGFEIDFRVSDLFEASGRARTIFGCRNRAYYKNAYQFTTYTTSGDGDVGGVFAFGSVSSSSEYKNMKYSCHMNNIKRMKISFRNFIFTDAEGTETLVTENMEFTDPINIPLFALNDNGGFRECANMTLYRCKFYDGDILIRDFVPVLNGSEAGLFDLANGQFYGNDGSGEFTY